MSQTYLIKNKAGDVINTIIAEETFVKDNFDYFEKQKPTDLEVEQDARKWRDAELVSTDNIAIIPDWPNRASYLVYRQALRDWPATENFPDTRPTLGV
jgi:hypothetical protein